MFQYAISKSVCHIRPFRIYNSLILAIPRVIIVKPKNLINARCSAMTSDDVIVCIFFSWSTDVLTRKMIISYANVLQSKQHDVGT